MSTLRLPSLAFVAFVTVGALASLASLAGCSVNADDVCIDMSCTAHARGPARGKRADGRIDVDAVTAWPGRGVAPTPLTAQEIARACAVAGACASASDKVATKTASDDEALAMITALCAYPDGTEERAVPTSGSNERWSYWVREVLARAPSCAAIQAIHTDREGSTYCEEDGCWTSSGPRPAVSCAGTVATMVVPGKTWRRDCSHAYARCDAGSETGCTDRAPLACDKTALDRCDGEVKLGCDGAGNVSFHDCSLIHAQCVQHADGAECVPREAGSCELGQQLCDGSKLSMCVFGGKVAVDCADFGGTCTRGHCALASSAKAP
ncbi:MAG: hypothetical protein NVSMB47_06680 [Polyangiales bacterium]